MLKLKVAKIIACYLFFGTGLIALVTAGFMKQMLPSVTFYQILFHLFLPLNAPSSVYTSFFYNLLYIGLSVLILASYKIYQLKQGHLTNNKIKILFLFSLVSLIVTFGISAYLLGFYQFIVGNWFEKTRLFEYYYTDPSKVKVTFPEKKRNLIYIVLESIESQASNFFEDGRGQDLIPELTKLAKDNDHLEQNNAISGPLVLPYTNWTIASVVAQTAGVPLKAPIKRNLYQEKSFLPGAYGLGDLLKEDGYQQKVMFSHDKFFGGTGYYFINHGDFEIFDYQSAVKLGKIGSDFQDKRKRWGFGDKKLFQYAKEEIIKMRSPFNLTLFTLDTHVDLYQDEIPFKQYKQLLGKTSKYVNDFVNWCKKQSFYKNTTIVIVGDHPYMGTYYEEIAPAIKRRVYLSIINPANNIGWLKKTRNSSLFDIFPTIVASLGGVISGNKLGLGVNLYSDQPTLLEQLGEELLISEIQKDSLYYMQHIMKKNKGETREVSWKNTIKKYSNISRSKFYRTDSQKLLADRIIGHAAGGIDNYKYTNSYEALKHFLKSGGKLFEIDFLETIDHKLIAAHDWEVFKRKRFFWQSEKLTLEQTKKFKIFKKYTPLLTQQVLKFLLQYPESILITDKIKNFKLLLDEFKELPLERLIVEVFSEKDYKRAKNMGIHYPALCCWTYEQCRDYLPFIFKEEVQIITVPVKFSNNLDWVNLLNEYAKKGITIFAFSSNDKLFMNLWSGIISAYYSDFVLPE